MRAGVTHQSSVELVQERLRALADPSKAAEMQAYMKTEMPFYGVQKTQRAPILREVARTFPPSDRHDYEGTVLALWALAHREEKYLALGVARHFKVFVVPDSLPLYQRLIVEGAWWDLVDEVATHLVGDLVVGYPGEVWPLVDTWIVSEDMWLRRSALICQVGAKERTDADRLFRFCAQRAFEKEFFIRKAIGWRCVSTPGSTRNRWPASSPIIDLSCQGSPTERPPGTSVIW